MKDNKEQALNDFLSDEEPKDSLNNEEPKDSPTNDPDVKSKILDEREGLIERVDRVLVTQDGRQLLREQY